MDGLALVVCSLAAYRLARLTTEDHIWQVTRDRFIAFSQKACQAWQEDSDGDLHPGIRGQAFHRFLLGKAGELLSCPFCMGVWWAAFCLILWKYWPDGRWFCWFWAAAGTQAFLAARE